MALPIVIFGKNGQVAKELVFRAAQDGFSATALGSTDVDITSPSSVRTAIDLHCPTLLINTAAYTAVDKAEVEVEAAFALNAQAPKVIADAAREVGIPLLHISTDYVFDGSKPGPYLEADPIHPESVYGRSKAEGEFAVANTLARHIIVRTSWVFSHHGNNFVKTMVRLAAERTEIRVVDDQHGRPTYAGDLAKALLIIAKQCVEHAEDATAFPWGLYHFANATETTWWGFASAIMAELAVRGLPVPAVLPMKSEQYPTAARRPKNSVLDCARIERQFGIVPDRWTNGVRQVLNELVKDRAKED